MTHELKRKVILTGYANDLDDLIPLIAAARVDMSLVDEKALGSDGAVISQVPNVADVVVFVMSLDTCYSSRLHGIFVYVHDHVSAPQKYLLAIGDVDLSTLAFPEIVHLPQTSITELRSLLEGPSSA